MFQTDQPLAERVNHGIFGSTKNDSGNPRFGAFFANPQDENNGKIVTGFGYPVEAKTSNTIGTDPVSACCSAWKQGTAFSQYCAVNWTSGALLNNIASTSTATANGTFHIGQLCPALTWMKPYVGQIAEVRVYKRPLTRRERCRIQMEMFAHYGMVWESHGYVEPAALKHYANSALLDGIANEGVSEGTVSSASTGGLDLSLTVPSTMGGACAFLTHDGGFGLARKWFFSAWGKTRTGSGLVLSFDVPESFAGEDLSLMYRATSTAGWTKVNVTGEVQGSRLVFTLPANTWGNGWYRLGHSALSAWFRADWGVVTNVAGQVEGWRNLGISDTDISLYPAEASHLGHVIGVSDAANGCPAARFDGEGYLKSSNSCTLAATAVKPGTDNDRYVPGAAWFVVFRPGVAAASRGNMAPFALPHPDNTAYRCGTFFSAPGAGKTLTSYLYDEGNTLTVNASDDWQILSYARWARTPDFVAKGQVFNNGVSSAVGDITRNPWTAYLQLGHLGMSWAKTFAGDIAELRFYNGALNAADRAKVEISLAARYGISVKTAGMNGVPPADYQKDIRVFNGKYAGYNGTSPTNAVSGELTLTCLEPINQTPDQLTFVAHDAAEMSIGAFEEARSLRSWFVSSGAADKPYRLSFAGLVLKPEQRVKLLYRADAQSSWRKAATSDQGTFELSSLPRGFYTIETGWKPGMRFIVK